jgi:two-component system sensor histidine kinase ChvG
MQDRKRLFSRLTLKIFAVNGFALVILAFGLFYLGQYENNLIKVEQKTLERQARIYAGAIIESAKVHGPIIMPGERGARILKYDRIARFPARKMIRRLAQTTTSRIRLYDFDGALMGDSNWLLGPAGVIETGPSSTAKFLEMPVEASLDFVLDILPSSLNLQTYPDEDQTTISGYLYPDVRSALKGEESSSAWYLEDSENERAILLSAAVPLKNMRGTIGAVYLTRDGQAINNTIRQLQRDILMLFAVSLGFTFLLSLYLSGAIAKPLRKLSKAAQDVQKNYGRGAIIPNLSKRRDEIGDLSASLESMTRTLSKRIDSIENFAADVAHELKNPLTSLRSAVETVAIVKNEEDRQRLMDVILHDVNRLDRLITDISKSSRLDAELSRDDIGVVDLRPMLTGMSDHYSASLNLPSGVPMTVHGVESRLGQVFDNLLSNAKSFSDTLEIAAEKQGMAWHITVSDEGGGIPDNKLEAIFDRFYSERPKNEDFGEHSGLGLAICKQIIEAHQGQIYAENRYNTDMKKIGARFTVVLSAL